LTAFIDDEPVMDYAADRSLAGYVGLWTKADSVVWFNDFKFEHGQPPRDLFADLRAQVLGMS
jgi:hypothetical protein